MDESQFILTDENWLELKKHRNTLDKKVVSTVGVIDQYIPKKNAALEVFREAKHNYILGLGVILGVLVTAIAGAFHVYAGAAAAGIFSIFGAFFIKKALEKMKYFEEEYKIKVEN